MNLLDILIMIIATEALVELFRKSAPLQGLRNMIIKSTPLFYSERMQTHLFECGYCLSVWAAFIVGGSYYLTDKAIYFLTILAIHRVSNFVHLGGSIIRDRQLDIRANRRKL